MDPQEAFQSTKPAITKKELADLIESNIIDPDLQDQVKEIVLLGSFVDPDTNIDDDDLSDIDIWVVVNDWEMGVVRTGGIGEWETSDFATRLSIWGYVEIFRGEENWSEGGRDPTDGVSRTQRNADKTVIQLTEQDIDNCVNRPVHIQIGDSKQLENFLNGNPLLILREYW